MKNENEESILARVDQKFNKAIIQVIPNYRNCFSCDIFPCDKIKDFKKLFIAGVSFGITDTIKVCKSTKNQYPHHNQKD